MIDSPTPDPMPPRPTAPPPEPAPEAVPLEMLATQLRAMLDEALPPGFPETGRPFGAGLRRDVAAPAAATEVLGARWGRLALRACAELESPGEGELDALADAVSERLVEQGWTPMRTVRTTGSRGPGESRHHARDGAEASVIVVRGATRLAVDVEVLSAPTLILG